ncbi:helix-turn-helix domain-containing protein [Thermodesulfobacteriota bacterium]
MDSEEFKHLRKKLKKTQKQIAKLLGVSLKAVHSYEQGWRTIPPHVERQMFFLVYQKGTGQSAKKPCWVIKKCPPEKKKKCPAWEFRAGKLCWFITGTLCESEAQQDWAEKMKICRSCEVFTSLL